MDIHPFPYAIPDEYIVSEVPEKIRVFSEVMPLMYSEKPAYKYKAGEESAYIQQYRESRFAYTQKKGGWDCLRHYEILAAGCIPVFDNLDCPDDTMVSFPKELVKEACSKLLPWSEEKIDLYNSYVMRLLDHCRNHCSTSALAQRFLKVFPGVKKILMIRCHEGENYTRELLSIGLRRALGSDFIDYPRIEALYSDCDLKTKYGNGFTYGGHLEPIEINRNNIEERIKAKEFDVIIYGKVGRDEGPEGKIPFVFWNTVTAVYKKSEIAFLYGGDGCQNMKKTNSYAEHLLTHARSATCFVRELSGMSGMSGMTGMTGLSGLHALNAPVLLHMN